MSRARSTDGRWLWWLSVVSFSAYLVFSNGVHNYVADMKKAFEKGSARVLALARSGTR
jgi:hypothetical protein